MHYFLLYNLMSSNIYTLFLYGFHLLIRSYFIEQITTAN